jgi:hypothetical protein
VKPRGGGKHDKSRRRATGSLSPGALTRTGGFAEVYLGEHIHLGNEAAIKLLHTHLADEDTDAFLREARTIARLVHPHIVRVFDFGIEGEIPYLVMDYAPNGTVRKRYPKGVLLPLPTILSYVEPFPEGAKRSPKWLLSPGTQAGQASSPANRALIETPV